MPLFESAETLYPGYLQDDSTAIYGFCPFYPGLQKALAQSDRLRPLFTEAATLPDTAIKQVSGPRYGEIETMLEQVQAVLNEYDEPLHPEYLKPLGYSTPDFNRLDLSPEAAEKVSRATELRRDLQRSAAARWAVEAAGAVLEPGLLDEPPYTRQTLDGSGIRACFNACFRMIYAAMTGDRQHEAVIAGAMSSKPLGPYSRPSFNEVHPDEAYMNVFATETFQKRYGRTALLNVTGAELSTISTVAAKLKAKAPEGDREVYSIISLGTEQLAPPRDPVGDIWHTNVLLSADEESVSVHDPTTKHTGAPNRRLGKAEFYRRWATAFNRAYIVAFDPID